MQLDFELKGVDKVIARLNDDIVRKALVRTLNEVQRSAFKASRKEIRKVYAVKDGDIRKTTRIERANKSTLRATLFIKGKQMPIMYFGARQVKKGVSVKIKKNGGRKLIKGAFIGKVFEDKVNVYKRKGRKRFPLETVTTTSMPQMFGKEGAKAFEYDVNEKFTRRFKHHFDFYIGKA